MDRYAFLADLVTTASDCVNNTSDNGCPYEVFVSPGVPPSDCSHIAAYWTGSVITGKSERCLTQVRESFTLSLNRCCLKNTGEEFNAALEDNDAMCFINDFGALFECIVCEINSVLKPYVRSCQDVIVQSGQPDPSAAGGCYGGSIMISFTRLQPCCPPPVNPPAGVNIVSASSPSSETVRFEGTGLDNIGRIELTHSGGSVNWYNEPEWGPGLNDPALIIVQWTSTVIEIQHGFVAGFTAQSATTYDLTNPPTGAFNGSFDFPDFLINP